MKKGSSIVGKREVVRRIAKDSGLTQRQVSQCLNSLQKVLVQLIRENAIVVLKGILSVKLDARPPKNAYIPGRGTVPLPERHFVRMKPLIKLKE